MSEQKPMFGQADRSNRRALVIAAVLGAIVIGIVAYWLFLKPAPQEPQVALPLPEPVAVPLPVEPEPVVEAEPVAEAEPAAQPVAAAPAASRPAAQKPAAAPKPAASKPAASKPAASKPAVPKSATKPAAPSPAPTEATAKTPATADRIEITPLPEQPPVTTHEERLAKPAGKPASPAASASAPVDAAATTDTTAATTADTAADTQTDGYVLRAFPESAAARADGQAPTAEQADRAIERAVEQTVAGQIAAEQGTEGEKVADAAEAMPAAIAATEQAVQTVTAELEHLGPLYEEERITLRHLVQQRIHLAADVARTTREFAPVDIAFDDVSPDDPVYTSIAAERSERWVGMMQTTEHLQRVERALRIYREEVRQRRLQRPDWPD